MVLATEEGCVMMEEVSTEGTTVKLPIDEAAIAGTLMAFVGTLAV